MPFYRFLIHGRGDIANGAIGFYTTRWSWALTPKDAADKALKHVFDDWETGKYAGLKRGNSIKLEIEEWYPIKPWHIWRAPNSGHTFYSADS